MSFNIKKDRKVKKPCENNKTIENLHEQKMRYFKDLQEVTLPKLKSKLKEKGCRNKGEIMTKIANIEQKTEEYEYILSTSNILMEYYNIDVSENVINFDDMIANTVTSKKQLLTEKYYDILEIRYYKPQVAKSNDICETCNSEMILSQERYYTCFNCGKIDNEKILDGYNYEERCNNSQIFVFDYKRINYFTEWLTQIQANETTDIPQELIEELKIELYKRNIKDTSKLTNAKLKKILKEIDQSKYYEHIPLIISKLCNSKPFNIPDEICIQLKNMFLMIQKPFEEFKGTRKNFLSYPYTLYKFCEILELKEYLNNFLLLKNREKLMKTDILWKKIVENVCETTGDPKWKFIPSC